MKLSAHCGSPQERGSLSRAPDVSKEATIFSCPDISSFRSPVHNRCTAEFHRNHRKLRVQGMDPYLIDHFPAESYHIWHGAKMCQLNQNFEVWHSFLKKVIFLMRKAPVCFLWLCHNPAVSSASLCHKDVGLEEARTNTGPALKRTAPTWPANTALFLTVSRSPVPHRPHWCCRTFPQPPLLMPSCPQYLLLRFPRNASCC